MILRSARAACGRRTSSSNVHPIHSQGRYGVVSLKAPDIVTMSVLQIQLPHHTIGILGDSHQMLQTLKSRLMITAEASQSWQMTLRFVHQGETCTPPSAAHIGLEDESYLNRWFECVVGLILCSTQFSKVVS